jgi:hypothetical protein
VQNQAIFDCPTNSTALVKPACLQVLRGHRHTSVKAGSGWIFNEKIPFHSSGIPKTLRTF